MHMVVGNFCHDKEIMECTWEAMMSRGPRNIVDKGNHHKWLSVQHANTQGCEGEAGTTLTMDSSSWVL